MVWSDPDDYRLTDTDLGFGLIKKSHAVTNPHRHFHLWWEILYIVSGERTFFYAGRTLHITAGTILCIAPGVLHRALNPPGEDCCLYYVFFDQGEDTERKDSFLFNQLLPVLESCDPCIGLLPDIQNFITGLFRRLGNELLQQQDGYKLMSWSLLQEIMVTVSRQHAVLGTAVQPVSEMNRHVVAIIDYLNAHYREEISLSSVSSVFGLSEGYVSRTFKSATHFSFVEYVNSLRITKCCNLLSTTNLAVSDIASSCGFGSLTQFGRCFRLFTGKSPREYRN
jgi:AraC-like DNA-binding protein